MAILCCPASCAVKVTCAGRIKKDCPRYIAVILFGYFFLCCASLKAGIYNKVTEECLAYSRIQLIHTKDQLIPVVLCLDGMTDGVSLSCIPVIRCYFINHFHDLRYIGLRILLKIIQCFCYCSCKSSLFCFVKNSHLCFLLLLSSEVVMIILSYVYSRFLMIRIVRSATHKFSSPSRKIEKPTRIIIVAAASNGRIKTSTPITPVASATIRICHH